MKTEFRPPVSLKFDTEKEKDIIEKIQGFKNKNQLTYLCEYLLRIVLESPETLRDIGETKDVLTRIHELGVTPARYNFFSQVAKEVSDMREKVDAIYTMAYKTYMLAQMGKRLGLEEQAENGLRASFLIEKQVADLSRTLGVDNMNHTFVGNKIQDTEKMAQEVVEFIIESYDGIIEELKNSLKLGGGIAIPMEGLVGPSISQVTKVNETNNVTSEENKDTPKDGQENDEELDLPEKPVDSASVDSKQIILDIPADPESEDYFQKLMG